MKIPSAPTLSVVLPVYNERSTIEDILWRVHKVAIIATLATTREQRGHGHVDGA